MEAGAVARLCLTVKPWAIPLKLFQAHSSLSSSSNKKKSLFLEPEITDLGGYKDHSYLPRPTKVK